MRKRIAFYGVEPTLRWGRTFDVLELKFKMGERIRSAIDNLKSGVNSGKRGVNKSHVLPVAFAKRYFEPTTEIYGRPASSTGSWERMRTDAVKSRHSFYAVESVAGTDKRTLEGLFKNIEDKIGLWLKPNGISPGYRNVADYWLAWFIATQFLRTPLTASFARSVSHARFQHLPDVAYVAGNIQQAKRTARIIFTWHWELRVVGTYRGTDELLLGEHCVHQYARAGNPEGIMFTIKHNCVLICGPHIATQCIPIQSVSAREEQKLVRGLNKTTIDSNIKADGYVYRTKP